MKMQTECRNPLLDGSMCHGCRVFAALMDAERVIEGTSGGSAETLSLQRCIAGLGDVLAMFLSQLDDDTAFELVWRLHRASRKIRVEEIGEEAGMAGHA